MFRDIYKAANDSINAGDELLERVLSQKRRRVTPVYKYSSIAAACAAVAVSIAVAPSMVNRDAPYDNGGSFGSLMPSPAIEERSAEREEIAENIDVSGTERGDKAAENEKAGVRAQSASKSDIKSEAANEIKTDASEKSDSKQSSAAVYSEEKAESQTDTAESAPEAIENTASDTEDNSRGSVNTYTKSIVLCVNSADYGGDYYLQDSYDDLDGAGEYTFTEWSMEDYSSYLGADIISKLAVPSDFSYIGGDEMTVSVDESGKPMQDNRIFPYEGSGGRYITVITSKNTLTAQSQLSDGRYEKSDINGVNAVVTGGGGNYKCYMINGGISYVVTARGIDEEELANLLASIAA